MEGMIQQVDTIINQLLQLKEQMVAQQQLVRVLRFEKRDRDYTNLMNIACYRAAKGEVERKLRGEVARTRTIPYGVADSNSVRMKIGNYNTGIAGGNFGGGRRYATKTIEFLCLFNPTDEELDEAAAFYAE